MNRFLTIGLLLCLQPHFCEADDQPPPSNVTWKGSIKIGAELDDQGIPKKDGDKEKSSRIRFGFSANWSFSVQRESPDVQPKEVAAAGDGDLSSTESKLIELTNAERKKEKLSQLTPDPELMKMARSYAATMARLDQIGHDLEGKTFPIRMEAAKYKAARAGENLAEGQPTPAEAIAGWMGSPGHKANILQSEYTRIGVATATSKSGKTYWVQTFAKPF